MWCAWRRITLSSLPEIWAPAAFLRRGIGGLLRKGVNGSRILKASVSKKISRTTWRSELYTRRCTSSHACSMKSSRRRHGPNG